MLEPSWLHVGTTAPCVSPVRASTELAVASFVPSRSIVTSAPDWPVTTTWSPVAQCAGENAEGPCSTSANAASPAVERYVGTAPMLAACTDATRSPKYATDPPAPETVTAAKSPSG